MLIGFLLLVTPAVVYLVSFKASARLISRLMYLYRILAGLIVFLGSAVSLYLASCNGDQGSIAAYFFQLAVIISYLFLIICVILANWYLIKRKC
ncbi:MAG: hypothetical protein COW84_00150 [Gammaproteobacteria bacterium CG22_combo_CG10-13_8_21_14_all_40_8]|nr:MAG: hypothetical protein COW84_00150 [Gammaproteobacteria bacterium CG22_combo_CG10-13_8_21_14_all_40_8]